MKWIKPSGLEIETNDSKETIDHCKSIGWKLYGEPVEKDPKELIADEAMKEFNVKIPKTKSVENMQKQLDDLKNGNL